MAELKTIARHAGTVLVGQLAVMAFSVTDTIVAGRHGEASLAALLVGPAIFISVYVALMGILQALMPVWAEQRGARNPGAIGKSLRQALYLCAVASAVGMFILLSPGPLLRWTEVPQALRTDVGRYLAVLALALPPALLFRIYSTLNQAIGRPQLVTWLAEQGVPEFEYLSWLGIIAPASTPAPLVARISTELVKAARQPDVIAQLAKEANTVVASTPQEFQRQIDSEVQRWKALVQKTGFKFEEN